MEYVALIGLGVFAILFIGVKVGRMIERSRHESQFAPEDSGVRQWPKQLSVDEFAELHTTSLATVEKRMKGIQRNQILMEEALKEVSPAFKNALDKARYAKRPNITNQYSG